MFDKLFAYLSKIKDTLVAMSLIAALMTGLVSFAWNTWGGTIVHNAIQELGVDALQSRLGELASNQQAMMQSISKLSEKVATISPDHVVEFDTVRSYVNESYCTPGQWCTFTFRVRRTEFGETCTMIEAIPKVVNHGGVIHNTETKPPLIAVEPSGEWTMITGKFFIPEDVQPGIGQFYFQLRYQGCGSDPSLRVHELTPFLEFKIG